MVASSKVEVMNNYVYEYIEDFLFNSSKKSHNTLKAYKRGVQQFIKGNFGYDLEFLLLEDLQKIDYSMINSYFKHLYEEKKEDGKKKYKNTTLNNKLSAVKEFMRYMKFRKLVDIDVLELDYIKSFSNDADSHETVPMKIALQIIDDIQLQEKELVVEKVWYVKIAIETGLRMSEILRLTQNQFIELEDNYVLIKSKTNKGKGNEDWKEKITKEFYEELKDALFKDERQEIFTIAQTTIAETLDRSQDRLGVGKKYSPHSFKRVAVNNTATYTGDMRAAMRKGKHKNLSTTEIYMDDVEYGATGYFSMQSRVDNSLYSKVSHQELLEAINNLDEGSKLKLNSKLQELRK